MRDGEDGGVWNDNDGGASGGMAADRRGGKGSKEIKEVKDPESLRLMKKLVEIIFTGHLQGRPLQLWCSAR